MTTSSMTNEQAYEQAYKTINKFVHEMKNTINENKNRNRIEQIKVITKKHSIAHAWIRLWLDWDHQINNGGVSQYTLNGYHSTMQNGCIGNTSDEDDIHQEFVRVSEEFLKSNPVELGETFLSIIKDFKITLDDESTIEEYCNTCNGSGTESTWNEELDDEVDSECSNCYGSGEEEVQNERHNEPDYDTEDLFSNLDKRYYEINNHLILQIAEVLR